MAKTAVFLPGSIPASTVREMIKEYPHLEPIFIEQVSNTQVELFGKQLVHEGCDVFIARGLQAQLLGEMTSVPVVPLRITAQELGLLVKEVCAAIHKQKPNIALIGFSNMFCDVEHFEELFGIHLTRYLLTSMDEIDQVLRNAADDGMDAVIGGRHSCEKAGNYGLPAFFASGGTEGLSETLHMAEMICELTDTKRKDTAEISAMVENNFNGILQVGKANQIIRANRVMQGILNMDQSELIGKQVHRLIPEISIQQLNDAIYGGQETFSTMILLNNVSYAVNISPVEVDGHSESAILTFQEGRRIRQLDQELRRDLLANGFTAASTFEQQKWVSASMRDVVNTARQAARYHTPVLITGETGLEFGVLAECIHNDSLVRDNSFIEADCAGMEPGKLRLLLFGGEKETEPSLCELAQDGTLFLKHVEALSQESQFLLLQLVKGKRQLNERGMYTGANVRVIAASESNMISLVGEGRFRPDLYYLLSTVSLHLEPLRSRPDDIRMFIRKNMSSLQKEYDRFIHLTEEAEHLLCDYQWPGNLDQLDSVCRQIVLFCRKREADEKLVRSLLEQNIPMEKTAEEGISYQDKKAAEITRLLQTYHGSREKVAGALGISKTTLWRYMKKYGISD